MIKIIRTVSGNADFRFLVSLLDKDLQNRDGEEHAFYAQFNKPDKIKNVVLAYEERIPVATGALREFSSGIVEIKRMFVLPEYRGQGIAKRVLTELEGWAKEMDFSSCILETGKKQPEAIHLYRKAGYFVIPNYGQYYNVENSVCMKKEIK